MKTLASSLDISQNDLLTPIIPIEESGVKNPIFEESVLKIENESIENWTFIKSINLSSLPLSWFLIANFSTAFIDYADFKTKISTCQTIHFASNH